ncbi:MAG: peptidylprolyl isomerase [Thermodesulfobacteriota bacterium]
MGNKHYWITGLLSVVIIMHLTTAWSAKYEVVAIVNGRAITEDALKAEMSKILPMASYHARVSEQRLKEIRHQALQHLIEEELLYQEAKKRKLVVEHSELNERIEWIKNSYSSDEAFRQHLAKTGLSYRQWIIRVKRQFLIQRIQQLEIFDKIVVTEAQVRTYYQENKEKFVIPTRLKLRHILISVNPGAMSAGWLEGSKKAQQVYARIQAGEDFAKVAKEVSDDTTSREKGGDIGWLHVGQLIPELNEVVCNMKLGEVSEPIRSIYGFHLFKLEGREEARQLSFEEINKESLKEKLRKKWISKRREEFLANLRDQANIQILKQSDP